MNTDRAEIPVIAVEDQGTMLGLAVHQVIGTDWLRYRCASKSTANSFRYDGSVSLRVNGRWPLTNRSDCWIILLFYDRLAGWLKAIYGSG